MKLLQFPSRTIARESQSVEGDRQGHQSQARALKLLCDRFGADADIAMEYQYFHFGPGRQHFFFVRVSSVGRFNASYKGTSFHSWIEASEELIEEYLKANHK